MFNLNEKDNMIAETPKIQTEFGHGPPPAAGHTSEGDHRIATHLPSWQSVLTLLDRKGEFLDRLTDKYPRVTPHRFVKELNRRTSEHVGETTRSCMLFPRKESIAACMAFVTDAARGADVLTSDMLTTRAFDFGNIRLYAIFYPIEKKGTMAGFWVHPGIGISTRVAEDCLKTFDSMQEVPFDDPALVVKEAPSHKQIRERIAGFLNRATIKSHETKISPDDVYLFQTGMAAIYYLHTWLQKSRNSTTVLLGFPFHSTVSVFESFAPDFIHLGLGSSEELDQLEQRCKSEATEGRQIQAVWTEVPCNPMLNTADLIRLRKMADTYSFPLIVDDTVGSFCNIDVLDIADAIITSLTKSFSGYADLMAGSTVLNPSSKFYTSLKSLFVTEYQNNFYNRDADVLELNSRDYLSRSKILNRNAASVTSYLHSCALDSSSSVKTVYYPSVDPSLPNYQAVMRPSTPEFPDPGYGCLFSVEFENVETTIAFYDNLAVHISPHLGAHRTLGLAYVKGLYGKELDKVRPWGMTETTIRVSVGLEDEEHLLKVFRNAVGKADELKRSGKLLETSEGLSVT